jgi:hypothetical protein
MAQDGADPYHARAARMIKSTAQRVADFALNDLDKSVNKLTKNGQ